MDKFKNTFTNLILIGLKILMISVVVGSIGMSLYSSERFDLGVMIQMVFYVVTIGIFITLIKNNKVSNKKLLVYVILVAAIARILWLLNAETVPVSDFKTMYTAAEDLLKGNVSSFYGSGYIARFPHLTLMVVYFAIIIKFFTQPIIVLKVLNFIASLITVYLVYKVCKEIFNKDRSAIIGGFIAAIFPPMITYVGVFATENIAIPFYLASIYFFIKFAKYKKGIGYLFVSGILLSIGNLFRMVAVVTLIAYVMYIIIYYKSTIKEKITGCVSVISSFMIILMIVNFSLKTTGIIENNLWKGSEPTITNILKGTNIENCGRWSPEDAAVPELCNYDYDKMEEMSKEIIAERFKSRPLSNWVVFYIVKLGAQWSIGDSSGTYWTDLSLDGASMNVKFYDTNKVVAQLFYVAIILLSYISLFNNKRNKGTDSIMNLFYIMICGYGASYLITENQGRYAYIVCWLFIIFAVSGIERLKQWKSL